MDYYHTKKPVWKNRKFLVFGGITISVIILALTIGLSVGLRKTPTPETCTKFDRAQFSNYQKQGNDGKEWLKTECNLKDTPTCPSGIKKPPLLIISMDGFRYDYLSRNITPVLQKMADCGVKTSQLRPSFPSKTFPNHYSIVTGLYPESHGIIDNTMVDLELDQIFTLSGDEKTDPRWWHGEPIWVTARKAGKKAATMFWPGSETKINGYYPNTCYWYEKSVPYDMRINRVLSWLDEPESTRPDVINLYFSQPDTAGHRYGPESASVNGNLTMMDKHIGNLMDGLVQRQLHTCIDIIIVSDHGMTPVSCSRVVNVSQSLTDMGVFAFDGSMARLTSRYDITSDRKIQRIPNGTSADEIVNNLECVDYNTTQDYYSKIYKKEDLPVRVHFTMSPRIEEVIITASDEWLIDGGRLGRNCYGGTHGHDNIIENMQTLFLAYGSSFKQMEIEPFENIELYNLMTDLLEISPAPNNGTYGRLHQVLRHPKSSTTLSPPGSEYESVKFPDNIEERERRRATSSFNCATGVVDVEAADLRLSLNEMETEAVELRHLGASVPALDKKAVTARLLTQQSYISAYSSQRHMSLWAAFTLDDQSSTDWSDILAGCPRGDIRLSPDESTAWKSYSDSGTQISATYLVPPAIGKEEASREDARISTNLVPMYTSFRDGIWKSVLELIEDYQTKYGTLRVIQGPVFDENHDGLVDSHDPERLVAGSVVPIPTHYYVVLIRCENRSVHVNDCPEAETDVMAMLIPHLASPGNCWNTSELRTMDYLQTHVARVRDVELITGLRLIQGKTEHQLVLKTRLAVGLWPRTSWLDEEQCATLDTAKCPNSGKNIPVLLISLDGFRPDYMQRGVSPTLQKLATCGVTAPFIQSVYPAHTFPNHYSMVTGLYPESHGIVENNMFDLEINRTFYLGSPNAFDTRWWKGEPIWNTVQKHNKTSATYFWPGSDVEIGGMRPSRFRIYDGDAPYSKRVDTVIDWLRGRDGFQADLAILYMEKVDKAGHEYGPHAPQVSKYISYVDGYLKHLMDGLRRHKLDQCVNIIITADHGMGDISCDRGVKIGDLLSDEVLERIRVYLGAAGRVATTFNKNYQPVSPPDRVPVNEILYNTTCKSEHMFVYDKESLPKRFHYTNNARIGEVAFVMEEEWQFNLFSNYCGIKGQHGWDPMTYDTMKGLFQSYGPSFKQNATSPPFENIELYNLITKLLNISGAPNNGTEGSLHHLLLDDPEAPLPSGLGNYTEAEYPSADDYQNRTTNQNSSGCSCTIPEGKTLKAYDDRLNLTADQRNETLRYHLPYGLPIAKDLSDLQLLVQDDYITAYSPQLGLPLWVAYSTKKQVRVENYTDCLRPDVRLEVSDQPTCLDYKSSSDYLDNFLFPPSLASTEDAIYDAYLLTNTVPMMPNFASGTWRHLVSVVHNWTDSRTLHIISGPAYDYDTNGIADDISCINRTIGGTKFIPVPSHYFLVMLHCPSDKKNDCADMDYDTQAFIVGHRSNVTNCMTPDEYLYTNRARLRDVELLTGLELLTAANTLPGVRARTAMPRRYGFTDLA